MGDDFGAVAGRVYELRDGQQVTLPTNVSSLPQPSPPFSLSLPPFQSGMLLPAWQLKRVGRM